MRMIWQPRPEHDYPANHSTSKCRKSIAFVPKRFNVTLSRGRFIRPQDVYYKEPFPLFRKDGQAYRTPTRYRLRLVFEDVSPYLPLQEWESHMDDHVDFARIRYWQRKEFVRDQISYQDQTWAETLDPSWWLIPRAGPGARD